MARTARPRKKVMGEPQEPWVEELLRVDHGFDLLGMADTLAGIPPNLIPEDRKALSALSLLTLISAQDGHTHLPISGPGAEETQRRLDLFLGPGSTVPKILKRPGLSEAFGQADAQDRPIIEGGNWIASARLHSAESRLASGVKKILQRGPAGCFDRAEPLPDCRDVLDQPIGRDSKGDLTFFSEEQKQAVMQAVAGPLTLLTGGPGTGKTSIVAAILRVALRAGLKLSDIALAAPTGKAAQRMGESIQGALRKIAQPSDLDEALKEAPPEPETLHRLLAFLPTKGIFRHHENNPLLFRLIVIDESSMVGLELMDGLINAMAPGRRLVDVLGPDTRLVLLGDSEQLPSVEAGAVFRDLVSSLPQATVKLTHSYRMDAGDEHGSSVLLTAQALRAGKQEALYATGVLASPTSWTEIKGLGAEHVDVDNNALRAFLASYQKKEILTQEGFLEASDRLYRHNGEKWNTGDEIALEQLFRAHEHAKILCPLRDIPNLRSVAGLNLALHRLVGRESNAALNHDLEVYAGEPVMIKANDYRRDLFNGDQGIVVKALLDGAVHQGVVFRSMKGFRLLPYRSIQSQLELAWALTVHKSQGSEFDRVVLILPPEDSPLLTQEILYTALTRARKGATILGSKEALNEGMMKITTRYTGLAEALAE